MNMARHGGILQGPRIIVALIAVTILFFYLKQPTASTAGIVSVETQHISKPDGAPGNPSQHEKEGQQEAGVEKSSSLSDKLFDYLKGHAPHLVSDDQDSVPHAEHAPHHKKPQQWEDSDEESSSNGTSPQSQRDPLCAHVPDISDILLVVRAPASDLYTHIPSHYLTFLRCVDSIIFSTISHDLGGYTVHDSLANISTTIKETEKEFELYQRLQEAQQAGLELEFLKEDNDHNLDKWGVIPSILAAYQLHPEKKWFMVVESDTYISLPNLASWVAQLDPSTPIYAGAQVMIGDVEFAHSGSGILMSQAALKALSDAAPSKMSVWETSVAHSCCGDKILSEAFKSVNITLHRSFPLLQGETPFSLDWSSRHWCKAAVTWHRMMPQGMDMLWRSERKWWTQHASPTSSASESGASSPSSMQVPTLLYKDLFSLLLLEILRAHPNRTHWDNLSNSFTLTDESRAQYAHFSFDACRAGCDLRDECLQYVWEPNKCRLGTVVRIGEPVDIGEKTRGSDRERMMSGWLVPRVERWLKRQEGKCDGESAWLLPDKEASGFPMESVPAVPPTSDAPPSGESSGEEAASAAEEANASPSAAGQATGFTEGATSDA